MGKKKEVYILLFELMLERSVIPSLGKRLANNLSGSNRRELTESPHLELGLLDLQLQQLIDAHFQFEEEKAAWASQSDDHNAKCRELDQEIADLIKQRQQVDSSQVSNMCCI